MVLIALLTAACDDDPATPAVGVPPTGLTVREYDGERLVGTRTLGCDPTDAVCAAVLEVLPSLVPEPQEVCTQIYGGPQRYLVEGVVDGDPVSVEVTRADGCGIARFDRLRAALGEPPLGP